MARKRTKAGPAEIAAREQMEQTAELVTEAREAGKVGDAVRAATLLARLTVEYHRIRQARLVGAETAPVRRAELMRDMAESEGSWGAAAAMADRARVLRAEREAAEAANEEAMTPEQRRDHIQTAAREAPVDELEIFVAEWLSRLDLELAAGADGVPQIRRV